MALKPAQEHDGKLDLRNEHARYLVTTGGALCVCRLFSCHRVRKINELSGKSRTLSIDGIPTLR
ncbi:hypothetical protein BN1044_02756 [Hafnia alvei]|uniref:Uncharacterized protein n=1 Tax=Hafnia alvei TaxID=569 RepID=A0A1C6Z248_HAFAL|nr:hypothetical protein BN1044_02756 [Hafnia alvei]